MRMATGLALVALGAILAFAVTGHPSFLNLQVAGWVIMLTGVAGMAISRRGYGWLRRRVVVRRPHPTAALSAAPVRPGSEAAPELRSEAATEETVEEFYPE
ncbi:MAG TPA: hypothetical protein VIX86_01120 [Streptosporangiaceae bacterium]